MNKATVDEVETQYEILISEANEVLKSENPDITSVDRIAGELTVLLSTVGTIHTRLQGKADLFKGFGKNGMEVVRSLRKYHETLVVERQMTR